MAKHELGKRYLESHLALAAFWAIDLRFAADSFAARALPPLSPPSRPRATAAGFFSGVISRSILIYYSSPPGGRTQTFFSPQCGQLNRPTPITVRQPFEPNATPDPHFLQTLKYDGGLDTPGSALEKINPHPYWLYREPTSLSTMRVTALIARHPNVEKPSGISPNTRAFGGKCWSSSSDGFFR